MQNPKQWNIVFILVSVLPLLGQSSLTQQQRPLAEPPRGNPADTEVWEPEPKIVTPSTTDAAPSSDTIVLFDGKDLDQWVSPDTPISQDGGELALFNSLFPDLIFGVL
jgi:hypothetical protein